MFRRRGNRCRARTTHRRLALNVSAARPRRVVVCSCLTVCGPACRAIGSRDSNRPERTSLQYTSGTGGPPLAPPMGVQVPVVKVSRVSPRCRGMSPRCRGRVAVCRASTVAGVGRRPSRRRRGLSRRRRGGSPCRKVSWGVAGCRGRVAAHHAAVASGSPPVAPPSRSVAGCRGCRGPSFSVKTATCTWTPIGGGGQWLPVLLAQSAPCVNNGPG